MQESKNSCSLFLWILPCEDVMSGSTRAILLNIRGQDKGSQNTDYGTVKQWKEPGSLLTFRTTELALELFCLWTS